MVLANPKRPVTGTDQARPAGFSLLPGRVLRLRWLGPRVAYRDAHALQRALWAAGREADDWLLLLEHPHVYTAGLRAKAEHMLVDPASVGAELLSVDRGGDITYHGPGQLVGYPVLSVPSGPGATPGYVHELEELLIEALSRVGLPGASRFPGYPGVWVGTQSSRPRKICAIGARHSRQRTMHGFALNVDPDMSMFGHIVPCGIVGKEVTSLAGEGVHVSVAEVAELESQPFGEFSCPRDGLGQIPEQGRHRRGRFEMAFGVRLQLASGGIEPDAMAKAGENIRHGPLFPRRIGDGVGGEERQLQGARQLYRAAVEPLLRFPAVARNLDKDILPAKIGNEPFEQGAGVAPL